MHAGECFEGTLAEIDEDCLVIRTSDAEIILEAEAIQMVERRSLGPPPAGEGRTGGADGSTAPVAEAAPQPPPAEFRLPSAAQHALTDLGLRVRALPWRIAEPDFSVYTDDLDDATRDLLVRELLSISNSYGYALKVRDTAKIRHCAGRLRWVAEHYNAPDCLQIAGRMVWLLGDRAKALDLFADAADALNDSSSCFDLAVAQRHAGELTYATSLRNCLRDDDPADDPALLALLAAVLVDGVGAAELAGLVQDAAVWEPGPARLTVLHGGLLCAPREALTGFPADAWDDPGAPGRAFDVLATAVHPEPAPAAPVRVTPPAPMPPPPFPRPMPRAAPPAQVAVRTSPAVQAAPVPVTPARRTPPTVVSAPAPASTTGPLAPAAQAPRPAAPPPAPTPPAPASADDAHVRSLAEEVRVRAGQGDLTAARQALRTLKSLAPLHSLTWGAEKHLSQVVGARAVAASGSVRATTGTARPNQEASDNSAQDKGPYARAEAAQRRKDYQAAQRFFEQAIEQGDQRARAVRRLVNLLSTRMRRRDEALTLLQEHRHLFVTDAELWHWSQQRSTILEHAGRWQEALTELRGMLDRGPTGDERVRLVGRTAMALLKTFQPQEARKLLESELARDPRQQPLRAALDQLIQAMETNVYSKVDAVLQLQYAATSHLSPLLTFHLDRCEYRGVRAEKVAKRNFTEDDIKRLDDLVSGRVKGRLGSNFPRERADYNLSAARIMRDLGNTDDRFRSRLRYFAAAMGDACAIEAKGNPDVIRTYYLESVSVKSDWDDLVDVKLRQLVMSFTHSGVQLLDMRRLPSLEKALALVMAERHLTRMVLVTLLSLPTIGETVTRLIRRVWADRTTRELFQKALTDHLDDEDVTVADESSFTEAWLRAAKQDVQRRDVYHQITVLAETGPALTALDRHTAELERIAEEVIGLASATDRARVEHCRSVVTELRQYVRQSVYVERERLFGGTSRTIRAHLQEYESAPTALSLQILHPYLVLLDAELKKHFELYQKSVEPENLKVELVVDRYLPSGGRVDVQLEVSNEPGASPVSNVVLTVPPSDDYTATEATIAVAESIAAGESKTCQISLVAGRPAIEQELITLVSRIGFTLRSQERVEAEVEPKSIRLHTDTEWTEIPNPYSAGLPVENPDMFMGRDPLIANLAETVTGPHRGSVIVYGQKRAGKSSVLFHLREKLTLPSLAVSFSIQDLAGDISLADFLYRICDEFHWSISNVVAEQHWDIDPPPEPDLEQIRVAPQQRFTEYMRRLLTWLKATPPLADSHLVLLIDEFSMVHKEIRGGNLPESFMKGWKAMLERGFFRCVLVGNDLMPRFIQEFPNEFQVATEARVSYLERTYAKDLIENPIRLPEGGSRYRGNAVDRILELTGQSPYYIQLFCHELVLYMNSEDVRGPAIGPADVEAVADRLMATLGENEFDNLLTPGDSEVTDISGALVMEVLRATRREVGRAMYHEGDGQGHPEAARVIQDLERREVLQRLSGNRYRIRVGLFSQWLQHRWA
ncbi:MULTISPECIES: hypothetical protein [unclassified Streptomyces]|uniref:hypothetical protein n=1 Tax=unclassified Streptomyces TaxID=2593676 RepID=UPI0038275F26